MRCSHGEEACGLEDLREGSQPNKFILRWRIVAILNKSEKNLQTVLELEQSGRIFTRPSTRMNAMESRKELKEAEIKNTLNVVHRIFIILFDSTVGIGEPRM